MQIIAQGHHRKPVADKIKKIDGVLDIIAHTYEMTTAPRHSSYDHHTVFHVDVDKEKIPLIAIALERLDLKALFVDPVRMHSETVKTVYVERRHGPLAVARMAPWDHGASSTHHDVALRAPVPRGQQRPAQHQNGRSVAAARHQHGTTVPNSKVVARGPPPAPTKTPAAPKPLPKEVKSRLLGDQTNKMRLPAKKRFKTAEVVDLVSDDEQNKSSSKEEKESNQITAA